MRLSRLALAAALVFAAAAAPAQDDAAPETPPAESPPAEAPATGLFDLSETIGQLEDAPAEPAPPPAEAAPAADEPPAAEASGNEPAAEEPPAAEAPATEPPATEPTPTAEPSPPAPGPAAAPRRAEPLTRADIAALDAAAARGQQLIAIARAGILATQDMLSRVSDPEGAGIAGWIAEPQGNAMQVIFYAQGADGGPPSAVYRAGILGPRVVSREVFLAAGERPALTPVQARMAAARDATDALDHQACGGQPFNVFVIPPASASDPVDVYQISPATRPGHFPLGGHFKSTVAADGSIAASRSFANACVDLVAPATPAGQPPRPIAVTHLLDPLPTEIHVFLSLWTGRPLVVVAGDPQRLFLVAGDRIGEIRERPANTE